MSQGLAPIRERLRKTVDVQVQRFGPEELLEASLVPAGPPGGMGFMTMGHAAGPFTPGDFILTHSGGFTAWLIRAGQWLRYWGNDAQYTWWSHAAVIINPQGDLIEAVRQGVIMTPISHYRHTEFVVVHLEPGVADGRDRDQVVAFVECWRGARYGFTTILSVMLSLFTGTRFVFSQDGQFICSGLVASALERTAVIFEGSAAHIMPADLAKHFGVARGSNKGKPPPPNWP